MTDIVDYSLLFDHKPHLRLVYNPAEPRRWRILDSLSDDQLYAHASTLAQAVQFMRTAARKGDATLDELSVEFHLRLADPGTWSVRADVLSERSGPKGTNAERDNQSAGRSPSSPLRSESVSALATILPFRRPLEPLDEEVRA